MTTATYDPDVIDTSDFPEPQPFRAPKFQGTYTHGTYVEARVPQFKVHTSYGHAKRSITMTNTYGHNAEALSNCALYEQVPGRYETSGVGEWVPVHTIPAGAEVPWRSQSPQ